jgi:tetratricopeptide (TPR) repeat protein
LRSPYYSGLMEEYRTILAGDPNNLTAITALGNAYFENGQWKETIAMYDLARSSLTLRTWTSEQTRGTHIGISAMTERAYADYRTAIKLDHAYEDALYYIGDQVCPEQEKWHGNGLSVGGPSEICSKLSLAEYMHSITATLKNTIKKDAQ